MTLCGKILIRLKCGRSLVSDRRYEEFFDRLRGQPIFRATMGLKRFKAILRYIRFDEKETRSDRRREDKLAAVRDVFTIINENLSATYSPGESRTIDK